MGDASDPPYSIPDTQAETLVNSGTTRAPVARHSQFPLTIGRYRIIQVLGQGGMGTVYEAEEEHPHRKVALKVIKPGSADEQTLRRFEQESEALGRLHHPGIAQIYVAATDDSGFGPQPYFAMEFVNGKSLLQYADAEPLLVSAFNGLKQREAAIPRESRAVIMRAGDRIVRLYTEWGKPELASDWRRKLARP